MTSLEAGHQTMWGNTDRYTVRKRMTTGQVARSGHGCFSFKRGEAMAAPNYPTPSPKNQPVPIAAVSPAKRMLAVSSQTVVETPSSKRRSNSTPSRILDAAHELFYAHGVNAVGVDAIVERSGVAKMTLYRHFESKDRLVEAWLKRTSERWRVWFDEQVKRAVPTNDPLARLLAVFDVYAEWFSSPEFRGCCFINCAMEYPAPDHPARKVVASHRAFVRDYLVALAKKAGIKRATELGEALAMLADGATIAAMADGHSDAAERASIAARALVSCAMGNA